MKKNSLQKLKKLKKKSKVPIYECTECKFNKSGSTSALDHMLESGHKLSKTIKEVVNGVDRIIKPNTFSHIDLIKEDGEIVDVIILCEKCKNGSKKS